ncbi:toll-like receptor 13 [Pelobates fuscus]|uniref:toll-like receptor 13 n=1 Tax=Pelobates fuscus TaxID=191477 RepID=UPI002FE4F725
MCSKAMLLLLTWLVLLSLVKNGDSYAVQGCDIHGREYPKVLCYKRGLTRVPEKLPERTVNLDISYNKIQVIEAKNFNNLTLLHEMNISSNQISFIGIGTFQNLPALRHLNLSSNRIESLISGMFDGLQNITTLLLNDNHIATIDANAFFGLPNLKVLGLSSNRLYTLKALGTAFKVWRLEEIYIANNSLQHFATSDLSNISTNLHSIVASTNPFSAVNIVTGILQNISYLDLSFTQKTVLWNLTEPCFLSGLKRLNLEGMNLPPAAVSNIIQSLTCTSLEEINLGNLNLTDSDLLIQELCQHHPKLKVILLHGNKYREFKDTFQNCTQLVELDISQNMFQHVSTSTFEHLGVLQQLSIANNKLTSIPNDLSHMSALNKMNLSNNHLSEVFLNNSKSYDKLKSLDLSGNKITVFYSSFLGNWSLQDLNLGDNQLLDISGSFQGSLKKLEVLWLRKNKLSSLSSDTFQNLVSLKFLNLIDNQLEEIETGSFNGLENLQTLLLGSNKLTQKSLKKPIFQGLKSLSELQLFNNNLNYESSTNLEFPPFQALTSLKLLTLNSQAHNGMENIPANYFDGLVSLRKLHAGNTAVKNFDPATFTYTPGLQELDMSNNHILDIDPRLLEHLCNLTELHINQNNLGSLNFLKAANYSKLILLRAVGNQLNTFTSDQLNFLPALEFLDLRSNPLTCSCENRWFINWVETDRKTQVLYFYEYECAYPPSRKGEKLFTFNTEACTLHIDYILFLTTCLLISNMMVILTLWKFWRWQVLYSYYVFLGFLYDRKHHQKKYNYQYDAFISYNSHDEEWVFNQLVPNLEETYKWKLCLHHRDFEPGKPIIDNIIDSIYSSRKTICIISSHYLESEWCSKEIQVASYRLFDDHADVLILLFLEDIPNNRLSPYHQMRKLIKKKTYLIWPKNLNACPLFWFKVNQALENKTNEEDENSPLAALCT